MNRGLRLTIVLALTACYVVGRLILLAWPGVSLSYLVLFVAAIGFGPRIGAGVGLLGRVTSDLLVSGLNPILVPMALVDVTLALLLGLQRRGVNLGQRGPARGLHVRATLLFAALAFTVAYSVLADTFTWLFYNALLPDAPDAARQALWGTLVLMGLVFNVPAVLFNMVLIPSAVPPVLRNLYEAGLLPEDAAAEPPGATPSPSAPG